MNERIRKLAIKSGIDIRGHLTGFLFIDEKPNVTDLEKFAELIVKECAGVNYNSVFMHGEFCAREVLEHFGIEE